MGIGGLDPFNLLTVDNDALIHSIRSAQHAFGVEVQRQADNDAGHWYCAMITGNSFIGQAKVLHNINLVK